MKLKAKIEIEWPVEDLEHYNATTLAEAAKNQQRIFDEGGVGVEDLIAWSEVTKVRIEPVK